MAPAPPPDYGILPRCRAGLTDSPSSIYHANGRQAVTMGVSFIPWR
ncbi:hypothetical protein LNO81_08105 [Klebsiella variicola subsp. variicola]|nr:hypothetical protein [Klebsiella variicola subsp. variicola]